MSISTNDRLIELEARLAEAEDALRQIKDATDDAAFDCSHAQHRAAARNALSIARDALRATINVKGEPT